VYSTRKDGGMGSKYVYGLGSLKKLNHVASNKARYAWWWVWVAEPLLHYWNETPPSKQLKRKTFSHRFYTTHLADQMGTLEQTSSLPSRSLCVHRYSTVNCVLQDNKLYNGLISLQLCDVTVLNKMISHNQDLYKVSLPK
jgi:hypothetical protein